MVQYVTLLCATNGVIPANTPTSLTDPLAGENAALPLGASVSAIRMYRDGNNPVSTGATIQLGVSSNTTKYITIGDSFTTDALNQSQTLSKLILTDMGLTAPDELRITLGGIINTGNLMFEIDYFIYA